MEDDSLLIINMIHNLHGSQINTIFCSWRLEILIIWLTLLLPSILVIILFRNKILYKLAKSRCISSRSHISSWQFFEESPLKQECWTIDNYDKSVWPTSFYFLSIPWCHFSLYLSICLYSFNFLYQQVKNYLLLFWKGGYFEFSKSKSNLKHHH